MKAWIKKVKSGYLLLVLVAPRASRTRIIGEHDGALKIALTSPPVDGKANELLIEFLSTLLKIPKQSVVIERGETSKRKTIRIPGEALIQNLAITLLTCLFH